MPAGPGPRPRIGAHVSTAGGLAHVAPRARRIGAEVVQVFPSNPRQWRRPFRGRDGLEAFGAGLSRGGLPLFVHTIYLINLASPDPGLRARSADALAHAWVFGARTGSAGVVTHVGSHRGEGFEAARGRVAAAVAQALKQTEELLAAEATPSPLPPLLLETSAGSANTMGGTPGELGALLRDLPGTVGLCLDTAHLFAAGFAIHTPEGFDAYLAELDVAASIARVGLVHLNDSRSDLGSRADRHENLWEGRIGRAGLTLWLRRPELREVPFVLETPGFAQEGPDRRNLNRAKRLRAPAPPGEGTGG